jgi:hypothetical protein
MALILDGTNGLSDVDGSAATPAIRGSDANTGVFFGTDIVGVSTGGTERVRVDASGNVGVGTTSPTFALGGGVQINNPVSTDVRLRLTNGGTGSGVFDGFDLSVTGTGEVNFIGWENQPMAFYTNSTERARIDSSGSFRVRNPTGSATSNGFIVEEDGANTSRVSIGGANSSTATGLSLYSTTAGAFRFFVSYAGQINATSTSITAISDQSLKENIRDLETGLTEVMALKPRRFDWKEETQLGEKNVAGFIAQEVEQVLPELVYDYQYNADETKKSLKMGDILPTLVKAIQEQQAIITALTARVEALEGAQA